jgi:hypothetical protein
MIVLMAAEIPNWASRERKSDLGWIRENFGGFWAAASAAYTETGRGLIVVDTTQQPVAGAGHPFGYFPQEAIEQNDDEDTKRLVNEYDTEREFVVMLLKANDRTSTYRVGLPPKRARGRR